MIKVVPTIKNVFEEAGSELPLLTRLLISLSDFLVKYWYFAILILVGAFLLLRFYLKTESGKRLLDKLELTVPIFAATSTSIIMARMTRTLGLLISSGIPILEALHIVSEAIGNYVYQQGLAEVRAEVERGIPMSVPLMKNTAFPVLFGQMVSVGEQTGRMDAMMMNLAKYYTEEADNKLKGMSSLIEPVVMVILGVGVALLIFAILVPIYNISSIG
jgi:type IV pilus assembly protein PilC